ncbi:VOC family protein, partial [Ilumatobacter nonamiensis]|uniref:VOC family protein n=1 Tax=Ilumatobacter nonamiensis TaxID=467093 RepID=UPI000686E6D0
YTNGHAMTSTATIFHQSIPVDDVAAARRFYTDVLGCSIADRDDERGVDFDFFGHHLIVHHVDDSDTHRRAVAGRNAAIRHFGVVLDHGRWNDLTERIASSGANIVYGPTTRRAGSDTEESLLLVCDPFGNAIEFKTFTDPTAIFRVGNESAIATRTERHNNTEVQP